MLSCTQQKPESMSLGKSCMVQVVLGCFNISPKKLETFDLKGVQKG